MTTKPDDLAHPKPYSVGAGTNDNGYQLTEPIYCEGGLTKREYFAAKAMQGLLANEDGINRIWKKARELNNDLVLAGQASENCVASVAVSISEALIKELNK